jgi:hypothetical protein
MIGDATFEGRLFDYAVRALAFVAGIFFGLILWRAL